MSAEYPTPQELSGFALRMVVERIRFRIDVMNERRLDGVSISKGFAEQIVRVCEHGSRLLENPEPAQAGLTADSGNGSANVSEGVTGGGECAVGYAAGEIGGHLQPPPVGDPAAATLCDDCPPVGYPTDATRCEPCPRRLPAALSGPSLLRPAEKLKPALDDPAQSDTAALDAISALSAEHEEKMAALRAERDELIAALREIAALDSGVFVPALNESEAARSWDKGVIAAFKKTADIARAALAKADGTKPSPGGAT